jgi:hypothetical protein
MGDAVWAVLYEKGNGPRVELPSRLLSTEIGCGGLQCAETALLVLPFRYELAHEIAAQRLRLGVEFEPQCPGRIPTPSLHGFDCESQPNRFGYSD